MEIPYGAVPHWVAGTVAGHPGTLGMVDKNGLRLVALRGRLHGYEGYDVSEQQLQVRSLACWGVKKLILTNACGAVGDEVDAGDVVLITEILDCQTAAIGSPPLKARATDTDLVRALATASAPATPAFEPASTRPYRVRNTRPTPRSKYCAPWEPPSWGCRPPWKHVRRSTKGWTSRCWRSSPIREPPRPLLIHR